MLDTFVQLPELGVAIGQTFLMLAIALSASILLGGPLGVLVFLTGPGQSLDRPCAPAAELTVNTVRSFPFIILLVALVPFTRVIAGTSIGPVAAAAAPSPPFRISRGWSSRCCAKPRGVIEAAHAARRELQIVRRVLLVEARSGLVLALTVLAVSFLSYSAVAGVVGGGGIGDLAIRYGYYRFQTDVMALTVALLVVLVQIIQFAGNTIARRIDKR